MALMSGINMEKVLPVFCSFYLNIQVTLIAMHKILPYSFAYSFQQNHDIIDKNLYNVLQTHGKLWYWTNILGHILC